MKAFRFYATAIGLLTVFYTFAQIPSFAKEDKSAHPYAAIVARNMFGLLPIPPPDTNPPVPPADPPPKIILNGIMTIFGKDQALFKLEVKQPKEGRPKEASHVLSQGEREDNIEVTKIDHDNRVVTFNNNGTIQEISLKDAGSGGAEGSTPVAAYRPGVPVSPADRLSALRQHRTGSSGDGSGFNQRESNYGYGQGGGGGNSGLLASSTMFGTGGGASASALNFSGNTGNQIYHPDDEPNSSQYTSEQNALLIEAQRMQAFQNGNNKLGNLLPPTPLTSQALEEMAHPPSP